MTHFSRSTQWLSYVIIFLRHMQSGKLLMFNCIYLAMGSFLAFCIKIYKMVTSRVSSHCTFLWTTTILGGSDWSCLAVFVISEMFSRLFSLFSYFLNNKLIVCNLYKILNIIRILKYYDHCLWKIFYCNVDFISPIISLKGFLKVAPQAKFFKNSLWILVGDASRNMLVSSNSAEAVV